MTPEPGHASTPTGPTRDPRLLLAYAPFAKWAPHFETDLEIIQNHLDAGGEVRVLSCDGHLPICEPNPEHRRIICALCQGRFRKGMAWLRGDRLSWEGFHDLDEQEMAVVDGLMAREWRDLDEVRAFRIGGADIGMAAMSSLVSMLREPFPDIAVHRSSLNRHVAAAAMVHFSLSRKLAATGAGSLSLFNGRFSALRPALRAAQRSGIACRVHERAGYVDRYSESRDTYPHDLAVIKADIERCYEQWGDASEGKRRDALAWYEERRAGVVQSWHSFTAQQRQGLLPEGLDGSALNVVVFNSSEDEFVAIEEWQNPFYATQNEAMARLLSDLGGQEGIRVFLRVHPNLKGTDNSQTRGIAALAAEFGSLRVVDADSPVSSYALIDAADIVVTFGSTVGIEASYARKPSILMGRAMHEDLDVCIRPASHEELIRLLVRSVASGPPALPAGLELGLVKFAVYCRTYGHAYRHVRASGLFAAEMLRDGKARAISASLPLALLYKLDNLWRLLRTMVGSWLGRARA